MATIKELQEKIAKLEKGINSKATSTTAKVKMRSQVKKFKSDIADLKATKKPTSSKVSKAKEIAKKLKAKYDKSRPFGGSNIEQDAERPAKPIGKRKSKYGNTYYEYRENRIDRKQPPKKYPRLEDGGMMAKGGEVVPYILWVSKDGEKRELYGTYKSQRAVEMAMKKLWDNSDYKAMGNKPKSMYEKEGFYADGGALDLLADTSGATSYDIGGTSFSTVDLTSHLDFNANPMFAKGGSISNQYIGKTSSEVWGMWTNEQKTHFLQDHKYDLFGDRQISKSDREKALITKYEDLPKSIRLALQDHVGDGQYAHGGELHRGEMYAKGGKLGLNTYKLRAEGLNDFLSFLQTGMYMRMKSFTIEPIGVPDVVVSFVTDASLSEIKSKLKEVADSHVMLETIKPINEYTGERSGMMAKGGYPISDERKPIIKQGYILVVYDTEEEAKDYVSKYPDLYYEKFDDKWAVKKSFAKGGMMAKGGMIEHGLEVGDVIKKAQGYYIYVSNNNKKYLVDLNKGARIEIQD